MCLTDIEFAVRRFVIFIQGAFGTSVSAEAICADLATHPYCLDKSTALSVIDVMVKAGELTKMQEAESSYFVSTGIGNQG